jgi:SAM-dependent methyltransferase
LSEESNWSGFYQSIAGREPRPLLARALALFEMGLASDTHRQAIDLGCGDGTETLALIEQGWRVLAIDRDPEAIRLVESKIPAEKRGQLQTQNVSFEQARLVAANLVYAGLSLPFCARQHFDAVWRNLTESIRPGGRFAGHFFGDRDTWAAEPGMTCLTRQAVASLFDQFEIERFDESEDDRPTALGDPKHWHVFEVIARKSTQ